MAKKSKIFTKEFEKPIVVGELEVYDGKLKIPGFGYLVDYHEQSCCEIVYADWDYLTPFIEQLDWPIEVIKFEIVGVKDAGFLLKFIISDINELDGLNNEVKFFVPCYNSQNGYYSSSLDLLITITLANNYKTFKRSISRYVKDIIV